MGIGICGITSFVGGYQSAFGKANLSNYGEMSWKVIHHIKVIDCGDKEIILHRGRGCDECAGTGYKGELPLQNF